jgi:hypothetical protein
MIFARYSIGVAKRRLQPMNDTTKHIAWWLTIEALMIVAVIWLAH